MWWLLFISTRFGFDLIYGGDSEQVALWTDVGVPALEKAFGGEKVGFAFTSENFANPVAMFVHWLHASVILQGDLHWELSYSGAVCLRVIAWKTEAYGHGFERSG